MAILYAVGAFLVAVVLGVASLVVLAIDALVSVPRILLEGRKPQRGVATHAHYLP